MTVAYKMTNGLCVSAASSITPNDHLDPTSQSEDDPNNPAQSRTSDSTLIINGENSAEGSASTAFAELLRGQHSSGDLYIMVECGFNLEQHMNVVGLANTQKLVYR